MGDRFERQQLQSLIIIDVALCNNATMTVTRIFAETHIGNYIELRNSILYCLNRLLDNAILGVRPGPEFILVLGDSKENDRWMPREFTSFAFLTKLSTDS